MDPIEEFDFKPITDGLGFHRKKVELKDQMKASRVVQETYIKPIPPKPKAESPVLKSPLPRKEMSGSLNSNTKGTATPSRDVIDELVKSFKRPQETFIEDPTPNTNKSNLNKPIQAPQAGATVSKTTALNPAKTLVPLPWMMSPFFIDSMLVVAMVLTCLLSTLLVTQADLLALINGAGGDVQFWLTFPAMGAGMSFTYMTLTRLFLGASLGELVFDIQLGTEEQRGQLQYGFQVALRSGLAVLTGLIPLPLVSMIVQKDYLGTLSGLRLYPKKRQR